jgi:hypothetical protein
MIEKDDALAQLSSLIKRIQTVYYEETEDWLAYSKEKGYACYNLKSKKSIRY